MLTCVSSSGRSVWGEFGGSFGREKVESRSRDIIIRLISLSQIHKMKMGGLRMCKTSFKSSHRPKYMVSGDFLAESMTNLACAKGNFGMNRKDRAVCLASKALKHVMITQKWN